MAGPGGGIEKWMEFELKRVNSGIVSRKKRLTALLKEEKPSCPTHGGEPHMFDRSALRCIADVVNEGEDPMLPVTIHFSSQAGDSCYVTDEIAASILRRIERFGEAYPYRDGKMWLPNSLASALIQKYPTVIQALFL